MEEKPMSTNEFSGSRRRFTQALGLVPLACSLGAHAQSFPTKSIRLVVGYTPGGAGDATARLIAKHYSDLMNQSVVVENKPGASATLAAGAVATAPPDGYRCQYAPGHRDRADHDEDVSSIDEPFRPGRACRHGADSPHRAADESLQDGG